MTLEALLVSDLPGAGYLKPFFGTGICFYLRHSTRIFCYTLEAFPISRDSCRTSSGNYSGKFENTVPVSGVAKIKVSGQAAKDERIIRG